MAITKVSAALVDLDGGVVINESSADADFRVESNGNANMLFVDGGNDRVGIGTASPSDRFQINHTGVQASSVRSSATNNDSYFAVGNSDMSDFILLFGGHSGNDSSTVGFDDSNNLRFATYQNHTGTFGTERMRIDTSGKVAIGTTSAAAYLDVRAPSGVVGPTVAQFKSDQHGLGLTIGVDSTATYLNSNNNSYPLVLQSGGAPVLVRTATINGDTSSMHIDANTANKFCTTISHNGNTTNRFGLQIACGTDDNSGTNTMVSFLDGNFDGVGSITASGGTVTYGAFTAHHEVNVPDSDNPSDESDAYPYGTLVEIVSTYLTDSNKRQSIRYTVQKSQSANSKKVLGAYASNMRPSPMCPTTGTYANNLHNISILGDGHVLCNNTGGNIEIGDGICTSAVEGIGMKATVNPSMIVAIAQEDVTFSGSETKLVAVQFGVQQFTPWS